MRTEEVQFAAFEQLPLDRFARFQTDGGGQGEWEADVEARVLATRANRLDTQGIGGWHFL